jgi:hypothetical protein
VSKKFKFIKPWKRWNVGDIIDAYEYNRIPGEIKPKVAIEYNPVLEIVRQEKLGTIQKTVTKYFKPKMEDPLIAD